MDGSKIQLVFLHDSVNIIGTVSVA